MGTWLLAGIGILVLVAIVASAVGQWWGPLILGIGYSGLGVLLVFSGFASLFLAIGLLYLTGGLVEFMAAHEFWAQRAAAGGPSGSWRVTAAFVGVLGTFGALAVGWLLTIAIAGFFAM